MRSSKFPSPPRLAVWLVKRLDRYQTNHAIIDDMEEVFTRMCRERGYVLACFWYWVQCLDAVIKDTLFNSRWKFIMFKNYMKIALRNIRKHKIYTLINIAGLSIGIACFLAIYLYVRFERSYDNYHRDADRIYRVATKISSLNMPGDKNCFANISGSAAPVIKENFPQVEKAARFRFGRNVLIRNKDKIFYESNFLSADQELFEILHIPVIAGNPDNLIVRPGTVVLTDKMAKKYFGSEDPVGKTIKADNTEFEITGIVADPPRNTHVKYDFISSLDYENGPRWFKRWDSTVFYTYLKVNQNIDIKSFENSINTFLKNNPGQLEDDWIYFLQPIKNLHLHSDLVYEVEPPGNSTYLYIFSVIGVFILLIASINFVNLTTARSTSRAKEVGLRKVIGAQRLQLIRQFLGESLLISVFSVTIAICLVLLFLPFLSVLTGIKFETNDLLVPEIITGLLVLVGIIGVGSGIYPALLLSGFNPALTLKGIFRSGLSRIALRKYLVVFQFAISVILITATLIVYFQLDFMKNANLGFDKEQKLIIGARLLKNNYESIKNEFLQYYNIKGAAASSSVPGRGNNTSGIRLGGKDSFRIVFNNLTVDYDFFSEYKLELAAGEEFQKDRIGSASRVCIINETGVKVLGLGLPENALGREILAHGTPLKIIGIVKDFHYRGLQQKIDPLFLMLPIPKLGNLSLLTLTVTNQNLHETLKFVENKWNELNLGAIFSYRFLDEDFERLYRTEERVGRIFSTFTALGLFIAFLGLFGLVLYSVFQRTKEIGIRKILGATVTSIIILLAKEFIKWITIGIVIAFPIAYYAMDRWLQNFAYRIEIGWLPFVGAAVIAIVLSLLTVSFQALRAATANPVDSLRYE